MEILLLEPLVPEALAWLQERHEAQFRPELLEDAQGLHEALKSARAVVLPRRMQVTRDFLQRAPLLKAVARTHGGTDNTDLEACQAQGVQVLQASRAHVRSNAEFMLGALLLLMRPGVLRGIAGRTDGLLQRGREMQGSTIGLLGISPVAQSLAALLRSLGVQLVGYDPAIHYSSPIWGRLGVRPVSLPELMSGADAVSLQMLYASRYHGFINQQALAYCRPRQLWVSTSRSQLFDPHALAAALKDGRIEACLLDGAERGFAAKGSPLHGLDNFYLTPRQGSNTREAQTRSSWYLAHRMHEALQPKGLDSPFEDSASEPAKRLPHGEGLAWSSADGPGLHGTPMRV